MFKTAFICAALLIGLFYQQPTSAPAPTASLDFEFFKTKVQPIFLAKRPGHARCVSCHGSSTAPAVFRLQPLAPGSTTWTDEQSRKNFEVVSALVAPGSLQSPLLTHPLAVAFSCCCWAEAAARHNRSPRGQTPGTDRSGEKRSRSVTGDLATSAGRIGGVAWWHDVDSMAGLNSTAVQNCTSRRRSVRRRHFSTRVWQPRGRHLPTAPGADS